MNDAGQAGRRALRILLIEDNPADARLTTELLRDAGVAGMDLVHAETLAAGIARLAEDRGFSVVLADLSLPDAQGSETVCRLRESDPRLPLIILTSLDDERIAVEMLHN